MILRESIAANSREGKFQFRVRQNSLSGQRSEKAYPGGRPSVADLTVNGGESNETSNAARRHKRLGIPTVLPRCGARRLQTCHPRWRKCRCVAQERESE